MTEYQPVDFAGLLRLAMSGLDRMFDPQVGLFCRYVVPESSGVRRRGISLQNSMIAMIGLAEAEARGFRASVDMERAFKAILQSAERIDSAGDLGLFLWLCALFRAGNLSAICATFDVNNALARYRDSRECRTMELAWFLSGLCHAALADPDLRSSLRHIAHRVCHLLRRNQGPAGIFAHSFAAASLSGLVRGRIGSFADQVYPVYALARFLRAYGDEQAVLRAAASCADAICRLQGALGQWWWHYDAVTGEIAERYPVYSVQQDGMAPMALLELGDLCHIDYAPWIEKGLCWIGGQNELATDMRDGVRSTIWRNIHPGTCGRYLHLTSYLLGIRTDGVRVPQLRILFETHSYHFGWLLYACTDLAVRKLPKAGTKTLVASGS